MSVKVDMSTKGQREMLRNGLCGKKASQIKRKAKSHKVAEVAIIPGLM